MFIRQYPKSGLKSWRTKKVQALDGKLFYTNDEYINHFTNIIIEITEKNNYEIKDLNKLRDNIASLLYKVSDIS